MNKEEYLSYIEIDIKSILDDQLFINYRKQIFAWKLNAHFNRNYNEKYLWDKSLYLVKNACLILSENRNKNLAIQSLKICAELYEYLSEISEIFDKGYLRILSALCYDISGYQANAFCIASKLGEYELETSDDTIELSSDNSIIYQIKLILLKRIPFANFIINITGKQTDFGLELFNSSIQKWYSYILDLKDTDFIKSLDKTYQYYLFNGNTYLSHLIFLLKARLLIFSERAIWDNLRKNEFIATNYSWKKYIKLLCKDSYGNSSVKEIANRTSKFEFWISQLRAIEKGLLDTDINFVIQMPTSAGKTFIAELSILNSLLKHPQKKCIYIAPFKVLSSEKKDELNQYLSKLGFSVSALTGSYEIDEFQDVILEDTDVLIATPEKIDLLLRLNRHFFDNISLVVVDEGHIIGDISPRASLLEFLLIRLRLKISNLRILFISAVMPNINGSEYSLWLSGDEKNVIRSFLFKENTSEEWEPTRKIIGNFIWDKNKGNINFENILLEDETTKKIKGATLYSFLNVKEFGSKFPKKNDKVETTAALAYKFSLQGNTLVFCGQVPRIKSVANALMRLFQIINNDLPQWFKSNTDTESYFYSESWYGIDSYITKSIKYGIGIHFSNMPEQVKNAVENDYRSGKLRILLATNTIAQGINFPIMNLIFYETQIGRKNKKNKYIQVRDFWNIVGRAGRAGKETEGKVIFVINTRNDYRLYKIFTNKNNIEDAKSRLFNVLDSLIQSRISTEAFNEYIQILSEPYLLDTLTEEIIETGDETIIENIINNSLFKIQAEKSNLDITPIRTSFKSIFQSFNQGISFEALRAYSRTGFSLKSNRIIDEYIEMNFFQLTGIFENDDHLQFVKSFLELIETNYFVELESERLERIDILPSQYYNFIKTWIQGGSIENLQTEWSLINNDNEKCNIFIAEALNYLYPWALTAFLTIFSHKINIEFKDFPENFKALTSFIKYGLNNSTACLARAIGIKTRESAVYLSSISNEINGREFVKWISNLTNEEIDQYPLSKYEKENIKDISIKLTANKGKSIPFEFAFYIKGIDFDENRKQNSKLIKPGDTLEYKRDEFNEYDPYAIKIFHGKDELGFIPREFAKIISVEIDVNSTKYILEVKAIEEKEDYYNILTRMSKI